MLEGVIILSVEQSISTCRTDSDAGGGDVVVDKQRSNHVCLINEDD